MAQTLIPNQLTNPPAVPLLSFGSGGNLSAGIYIYKISFVTRIGETLPSNSATGTASASGSCTLTIPIGPSWVIARKIYRTKVGATTYFYVDTVTNNISTTYLDIIADTALPTWGPYTLGNEVDPSLDVNGILNIAGFIQCATSSASVAYNVIMNIVCNGPSCYITKTSATVGPSNNAALNISNNYVTANTKILCTIQGYTGAFGTNGIPYVYGFANASGGILLTIGNADATNALMGDLNIFVLVIN
jgi:hypothetical protein